MADPTFRAIASNAGSGSSIVVNKPAGTIDGDGMIMGVCSISFTTPITITTPSGWTLIDSIQSWSAASFEVQLGRYYRKAASEGASYTVSLSGASDAVDASIVTVQNVKSGAAWLGSTAQNSGTGQTTTFTGVTAQRGSLILLNQSDWNGTPRSPPSTFTERYDNYHYVATKSGLAAGATGNFTMTNANDSGSQDWSAHTIEVLAEIILSKSLILNQAAKRAAFW